MERLSVVIITFNEERNIAQCLDSVKDIADEVVVVDAGSTDDTVRICEANGCRVFSRKFTFHADQKQFAVNQAKNDWVFSIDADEMVSEELDSEIKSVLAGEDPSETANRPDLSGYFIPIRLYYLGRKMKRSGKSRAVRLFDRRKGSFVMLPVHEYVKVNGTERRLKGELIHHSYHDIEHHLAKINAYTSSAAKGNAEKKKSYPKAWIMLKFPVTFFIHYVIRGGFLDGYPGFMWAFLAAFYTSVRIAKTIEMAEKA